MTYPSEAHRQAARRATWAASTSRRYDLYRDICRRSQIAQQSERWTSHLAEIRHLSVPQENLELWWRFRDRPMFRWWLERYPLSEIRAMASDL